MSKYQPLWEYVASKDSYPLTMSSEEIASVLGFPIDHSFLTYKKETEEYGFFVMKISMKEKTVLFGKNCLQQN